MTKDEMAALNRGDLVRSKLNNRQFVVTSNYGSHATAVDSCNMTNPDEWEFVELYCNECSTRYGAGQPIFHKPPICHTRKKFGF